MNSAESADRAARGILLQLTSPPGLATLMAVLLAGLIALGVARVLRERRARDAAVDLPLPAHWLHHALEGAVILAPIMAALAVLLAAHVALGAARDPDARCSMRACSSWRRCCWCAWACLSSACCSDRAPGSAAARTRITLVLWVIAAAAMLGWLDAIEASLNRVNLVPGKTQFSLWGLLKGLVVVTAFVVVASLIARAIERHVMRLDQLAVSTRVGISKFTYFLLVALGMLLGINAAGVDVTTLNVLTGAIGLGLGFGLQSVASNFVSGFVLLMDKSIKPGDVISFTGHDGASTGNFGWVQELRGRYVVVRDRDGVDTLVPNQNLINNSFINWSYSDQRVRLKLPVTGQLRR